MNSKITLFILLLCITFKGIAQEEIQLASKDNVDINYQLLLEEEGRKKDKYILIINAQNNNDIDLYYEVPLIRDGNGNWQLPIIPEEKGLAKVYVRNSTGLFGDGRSIIGDQTELITTNNTLLFQFRSGDILTQEINFKVKSGVTPLLTNSFNKVLKPLEEFDLQLSNDMVNGNYVSNCGNILINIEAQSSVDKGDYLVQTTNGKQFIWLRTSETSFIRENSQDMTLTFNKESNEFIYSTSDGINCNWSKS